MKSKERGVRVALAQINSTLGNFSLNREKILEFANQAEKADADLVVFPECALYGYPAKDTLESVQYVNRQLSELKKVAKSWRGHAALLIGLISKNQSKRGKPFHNSAALVQSGKVRLFHKQLLPSYDVFDEARYVEPGLTKKNIVKFRQKKMLITICEDIWAWDTNGKSDYAVNPLESIKKSEVDFVVNLSASPFSQGQFHRRKKMVQRSCERFGAPLIYTNLVGGQDELIFDGSSFVADASGRLFARTEFCKEGLLLVDLVESDGGRGESKRLRPQKVNVGAALQDPSGVRAPHSSSQPDLELLSLEQPLRASTDKRPIQPTKVEAIRRALVLGIRDFCIKTRLPRVHLGLSGGIDSAVVLALATEAIGPSRVSALALPTRFNASESLSLAEEAAQACGVKFEAIEIDGIYQSYVNLLSGPLELEEMSLTHENLQSRIRGVILMAFSNRYGSLLLTTGNKSEYATGYATLYGDMCGGLAPIADLTKQEVYQLAESYNQELNWVPQGIIDRPPSAELRPDQTDDQSLPPYDLLDQSVRKIVEQRRSPSTETDQFVMQSLLKTEFKRWQAPPVLRVSQHAFGRGRRLPVANQF